MSEQAVTSDIRGELMGDRCKACPTSYGTCTDRLLNGQDACCKACYQFDTHNERSVMEHEDVIEAQWAVYAASEKIDPGNEVVKAAFRAAWERCAVITCNNVLEQG